MQQGAQGTAVNKVDMGPGSYAGFGVSGAAFVLAVVAYLTGDHSSQNVGTIVSGAGAALVLIATIVGRQLQAAVQTHAAAVMYAADANSSGTTLLTGTVGELQPPAQPADTRTVTSITTQTTTVEPASSANATEVK